MHSKAPKAGSIETKTGISINVSAVQMLARRELKCCRKLWGIVQCYGDLAREAMIEE